MSAALVKELRERTGLGLLECKKALAAAGGDVEVAIEELRKSSGMKAAKKAGRTAADGVVAIRIAADGKSGVIGEVNSETDFVARDENFAVFVAQVMDKAVELQTDDVGAVAGGGRCVHRVPFGVGVLRDEGGGAGAVGVLEVAGATGGGAAAAGDHREHSERVETAGKPGGGAGAIVGGGAEEQHVDRAHQWSTASQMGYHERRTACSV